MIFAEWEFQAAVIAPAVNILARAYYSALHQALSSWTEELFAELDTSLYHIQIPHEYSNTLIEKKCVAD